MTEIDELRREVLALRLLVLSLLQEKFIQSPLPHQTIDSIKVTILPLMARMKSTKTSFSQTINSYGGDVLTEVEDILSAFRQ